MRNKTQYSRRTAEDAKKKYFLIMALHENHAVLYVELDGIDVVYTIGTMSDYTFEWRESKNLLSKQTYAVCFEDVVIALQVKRLFSEAPHFNQKNYAHPRLFIVEIDEYAYVIPYVINADKNVILLKTLYPSRKFTKLFLTDQPS
jgi:hypothetical protein